MAGTAATRPTLGRIVIYRSRTGLYDVPALVCGVQDSLAEEGLKLYEESDGFRGVPPLDSELHVHLTCFTPGRPGHYQSAQEMPSEPWGGTFQEWNVPLFEPGAAVEGEPPRETEAEPPAGTWRWPERV